LIKGKGRKGLTEGKKSKGGTTNPGHKKKRLAYRKTNGLWGGDAGNAIDGS